MNEDTEWKDDGQTEKEERARQRRRKGRKRRTDTEQWTVTEADI